MSIGVCTRTTHGNLRVGQQALCIQPFGLQAYHASYLGSRTWIRRKEETLLFKHRIELLPADGRLNDCIHVIWVNRQDVVHPLHVDAYSAARRRQCTAEARSSRKDGDWNTPSRTSLHDAAYL